MVAGVVLGRSFLLTVRSFLLMVGFVAWSSLLTVEIWFGLWWKIGFVFFYLRFPCLEMDLVFFLRTVAPKQRKRRAVSQKTSLAGNKDASVSVALVEFKKPLLRKP